MDFVDGGRYADSARLKTNRPVTNFIILVIFCALFYAADLADGGFWRGRVFPLTALGLYFYLLLVVYDLLFFRGRVPRRNWRPEEIDGDNSPPPPQESPDASPRRPLNPPGGGGANPLDDSEMPQKKIGWWQRR